MKLLKLLSACEPTKLLQTVISAYVKINTPNNGIPYCQTVVQGSLLTVAAITGVGACASEGLTLVADLFCKGCKKTVGAAQYVTGSEYLDRFYQFLPNRPPLSYRIERIVSQGLGIIVSVLGTLFLLAIKVDWAVRQHQSLGNYLPKPNTNTRTAATSSVAEQHAAPPPATGKSTGHNVDPRQAMANMLQSRLHKPSEAPSTHADESHAASPTDLTAQNAARTAPAGASTSAAAPHAESASDAETAKVTERKRPVPPTARPGHNVDAGRALAAIVHKPVAAPSPSGPAASPDAEQHAAPASPTAHLGHNVDGRRTYAAVLNKDSEKTLEGPVSAPPLVRSPPPPPPLPPPAKSTPDPTSRVVNADLLAQIRGRGQVPPVASPNQGPAAPRTGGAWNAMVSFFRGNEGSTTPASQPTAAKPPASTSTSSPPSARAMGGAPNSPSRIAAPPPSTAVAAQTETKVTKGQEKQKKTAVAFEDEETAKGGDEDIADTMGRNLANNVKRAMGSSGGDGPFFQETQTGYVFGGDCTLEMLMRDTRMNFALSEDDKIENTLDDYLFNRNSKVALKAGKKFVFKNEKNPSQDFELEIEKTRGNTVYRVKATWLFRKKEPEKGASEASSN